MRFATAKRREHRWRSRFPDRTASQAKTSCYPNNGRKGHGTRLVVSRVVRYRDAGDGRGLMVKCHAGIVPMEINGREIRGDTAIQLARYMTRDRAFFVRTLRNDREFTWRMVARECAIAWSKDWPATQMIGEALCRLAAATLDEDWD